MIINLMNYSLNKLLGGTVNKRVNLSPKKVTKEFRNQGANISSDEDNKGLNEISIS